MDNQYNENDIFETEKVEERENPVEQVKAEEPAAVAASGSAAKKRELPRKICAVVLSAALFGSVASAAFYGVNKFLGGSSSSTVYSISNGSTIKTTSVADGSLDVSTVASENMAAMVSINTVSVEEVKNYYGMFGGQSSSQETQSSGSGIIIGQNDTELLCVTNAHVINGADTISVCFVDGSAVEASVKGSDTDNDLAVISVKLSDISDDTKSQIKVATIGDSSSLKVGEQVVAIGNALGYGQSVTSGIVSGLNRQLDDSNISMIQTDAAINPGNSGGALLNMSGEVIGINTAKAAATEVEGMGYAISMSDAMPVIEELMTKTTREKVSDENASYLGISARDISSDMSSAYGIPEGIYVTSVASGSAAEKAGITEQSVITKFDGVSVSTVSALESRLEYYAAGETVEVTLQVNTGSGYTEKTVSVTLGSASEKQSSSSSQNPFSSRQSGSNFPA